MNCYEISKYIAEQAFAESDAIIKYEQFLGMVESEIHCMQERIKNDAVLKAKKEDDDKGEEEESDDDDDVEMPEMYKLSDEKIEEMQEDIKKMSKLIEGTREIIADEKQHLLKFMGLQEMFDEIKPKVG